jgi:DNA (cytosine-5)-methyltransferase 1
VVDAADPFIVTYYGDKGVAGEFRGQSVDEPLRTQTTENRHGIVVPFISSSAYSKTTGRGEYIYHPEEPVRTITASNDKILVAPRLAPFITECSNASSPRAMPIDEPLRTVCAETKGGHFALASAHIIPLTHQGGDRTNDLRDPFPTVTGAHRGEIALVSPTLIQTGYGERTGQEPRVPGLGKPLGTVVAGGTKHALVAAFLAQQNGGFYDGDGRRVDAPLSTITQRGTQQQIVAASIVRNMGASVGYPASEPVRTVMQQEKDGLVTSHLIKYKGSNVGQDVRQPLQTITAGGYHFGEVRAFLMKYYGTDQDPKLAEPLHTVTTKDRFGLVEVKGEDYEIVDIGLRMLIPRELFRAQGFYDTYIIDRDKHGRPFTKTAQVKMCGNSVCPGMAAALVAANVRSGREVGIA